MEHVCSEKGEKLDTRKEDAFPEVQKKEKRRGKGCTCKQKGIKPATLRLVLAGRRAPPKLAVAMPRGEKKSGDPALFLGEVVRTPPSRRPREPPTRTST